LSIEVNVKKTNWHVKLNKTKKIIFGYLIETPQLIKKKNYIYRFSKKLKKNTAMFKWLLVYVLVKQMDFVYIK